MDKPTVPMVYTVQKGANMVPGRLIVWSVVSYIFLREVAFIVMGISLYSLLFRLFTGRLICK